MGSDVAARAERLGAVLKLAGGMPYLDPREVAGNGLPPALYPGELAAMNDVDERDLALINACLEVEQDVRERSYAAVERLLALLAGRRGDLPSRITSLPDRDAARALCALYDAGWVY
jgi:hypothetical protein